jgi:acetoin utilization deacetylase AcuC-like enzyme/GNAT superfamily N-acetyltransferase
MSMAEQRCRSRYVYRAEYGAYDFGPGHPLRPERAQTALDLMCRLNIAPTPPDYLVAPEASREQLELAHQAIYIDAVQNLDLFADDPLMAGEAARWGLGRGDTPPFVGMHAAAAMVAGGTTAAVRAALDETLDHAFHPMGGLHHALRDRASGFCIYNDAVVAVAAALREHEARVLYLDFDAHHGDGVQAAFYDEPRVLTFSIHETGRHLFPGTGFVQELGEGLGRGYSLNLPVEPFTDDESWTEVLDMLLPAIAEWFAPDLVISQHGCDSHAWDPLTDLRLTTRAFTHQARLVHGLAHRFAGGKWIALGGGGYEWQRVVPRSWAIVWAELMGHPLVEFRDESAPETPRRAEIADTNRARAESLRRLALPALVRHAYPAYRLDASPPKLPSVVSMAGDDAPTTRVERLTTARGDLYLRDLCPGSLIERLLPDPGLSAFARSPVREHALLIRAAEADHAAVSVAHTHDGTLVGSVVLSAGADWWSGLDGVYELTLEVSRDWRRLGIARALLNFTAQALWMEHLIVVAMGLEWHWDLAGAGLSAQQYGHMLTDLLRSAGFRVVRTSEPNVAMHPANLLLVRVGAKVSPAQQAALDEALFIAPSLRTGG